MSLYEKNPRREFVDTLLASSDQETVLMQQAADMTEGAALEVLHQGAEGDDLRLGGDVFVASFIQTQAMKVQVGFRDEGEYYPHPVNNIDPVAHRKRAETALLNGGAVVKLTVSPPDTGPFYRNLEHLRELATQL